MMNTTPATIPTHAATWKSRSGFSRGAATGDAAAGADGTGASGVSLMPRIMPQPDNSRSGVRAMKFL